MKVGDSTDGRHKLIGAVDMHVHGGPDVVPRLMDDLQIARHAQRARMQGIVLKSHLFSTVGRAWLVNKLVPGVQVRGGVVLNQAATGGLNVEAVRANLALGGKVVWMPTIECGDGGGAALARAGQGYDGVVGPTTGDVQDPQIIGRVRRILREIAGAGAVLATGHLTLASMRALVELAVQEGVTRILVTHPDSPFVRMPVHEQVALSRLGVFLKRCAYSIIDSRYSVPVEELSTAIRATGVERNVISSHLGQVDNPSPVAGLGMLCDALARQGFEPEELEVMLKTNPSVLLGMGDISSADPGSQRLPGAVED